MGDYGIYLILFGVGLVAGFLNIMAGGGSALSLPVLIFLGLDPSLANGTNRVAILIQNASAVMSFRGERVSEMGRSLRLSLFTIPGAVLGAVVAVRISDAVFRTVLTIVLVAIVLSMVLPGRRKKEEGEARHGWAIYPAMVAVGFYGGFIQVGVGFLFMACLHHILRLDLVRVNMHKVFIIMVYTIPALVTFALTDNVNYPLGLALAGGNALGGWWAAKVAVRRGEGVVRVILAVALTIMAVRLVWPGG